MTQGKSEYAKILLKELETYRAHCLFVEARKRADELIHFIRQNDRVANRDRILRSLKAKIREIEEEAEAFDALGLSNRLSASDKTRIQKVFSSTYEEGTDAAVYEAATAFLVFGQYKEALVEFRKLIKSELFRVTAVKNIFRCFIGLSAIKNAVALYMKLQAGSAFPPEELERVRYFLHSILKMKGVDRKLPKPRAAGKPPPPSGPSPPQKPKAPEKPPPMPPPPEEGPVLEPTLDILSVTLSYPDRKKGEQSVVLDVNLQRKNTISMIVPGSLKGLIDYLKPGMRLENVQLSSTDVIFIDDCVVHGKSEIRVGEKRGDYTVTIKLDSA